MPTADRVCKIPVRIKGEAQVAWEMNRVNARERVDSRVSIRTCSRKDGSTVKRLIALLVVVGFLTAVGCGPSTTPKAASKAPGAGAGAGAGGAGAGGGADKDKKNP
jgi:hypothetical protein